MFIDFVLTKSPPQADEHARSVVLGELSDGLHITESFPIEVEISGYIELSFQRNESGLMEVVLLGEDLERRDVRPIIDWLLVVPVPEDGWVIPRKYPLPFSLTAEFEGEGEIALMVEVNGANLGEKVVAVRMLSVD